MYVHNVYNKLIAPPVTGKLPIFADKKHMWDKGALLS